jgi:hypothetical protein
MIRVGLEIEAIAIEFEVERRVAFGTELLERHPLSFLYISIRVVVSPGFDAAP